LLLWRVQGSNLGRLSRRIYSPLPLATRATRRHVVVTTLRRIADSEREGDIGFRGPYEAAGGLVRAVVSLPC
jgi:hypothetical protein